MANIQIGEEYTNWVIDNIVDLFAREDITVTDNARNLFALAMQMQVSENAMTKTKLYRRAEKVADNRLIDYYKDRYNKEDVNFNRAFHILSDWGIVMKYPWTTTGDTNP